MPTSEQPKVTIVGGGISGLTAALRLAQRGYAVTVYEKDWRIGGNLGAYLASRVGDVDGPWYDVYTHMYSPFYHNFWDLVEGDLGLKRGMGEAFEPRGNIKYLEMGQFPNFTQLAAVGSLATWWQNLMSGVAPPADMLLWAYTMIDTLTYRGNDTVWDELSVEGFEMTRPWNTSAVNDLSDMTLMTIWSIHSSQVSSAAYRRFMDYRFKLPTPLIWLLTGNLHTKLMEPLRNKIQSYGGIIKTSTEVLGVRVAGGESGPASQIDELTMQETKYDAETRSYDLIGNPYTVPVDPGEAVILAVPPSTLYKLVISPGNTGEVVTPEMWPKTTIYNALPEMTEVRQLGGAIIPVCYLAFKNKLPNIPKENVLLRGSSYDLTFLDLSQLWHDDPIMKYQGHERTVLALSASDFYTLPAGWHYRILGQLMIEQLHEFVGVFNPGRHWGDPDSDIDWATSYFDPALTQLFTNSVGGKQWQPLTHYPEHISNLYFAGDSALNDIRMATVESAVTSGLMAASAVWEKLKLGEPVEIKIPETYPSSVILALKTLMGPAAYAAKCWHNAAEVLPALAKRDMSAAQDAMGTTLRDMCILPYSMAVDWWGAVARTFLPGNEE